MAYIGIDFGTTNTALVYFDDLKGKALVGDKNKQPLPSIVALNDLTGDVKVGTIVKRNIQTLQEDNYQIVLSIKTILDDPLKKWVINGKTWDTIDVAAEIFKTLKRNASERNYNFDKAVVSVPINFAASKKICLKKAASKAGILIEKFISEPTAAFIAHYEELQSFENIIVFDWGGGTLDISALKVKNNTIQEIYTDNMYQAGDNIDEEFARVVYNNAKIEYGLKLIPFDDLPVTERDELIAKTEEAKIRLSQKGCDTVADYTLLQNERRKVIFTYNDLCMSSQNIVDSAISKLTHVITKSFNDSVNCVLCVGGTSNLRILREKLRLLVGEDRLYFPDNPQWDIAEGACTVASTPEKNICKLAEDIHILLSNNELFKILEKGQLLPCKKTKINLSTTDESKSANFVFQIGSDERYEIVMPVLGSIDEILTLYAYIDEYLVLHIDVESSKTKEIYNIFNYEKLELCYNIE